MAIKVLPLIKTKKVKAEVEELRKLLKEGTPTTWSAIRFSELHHLIKAVCDQCEFDCLVITVCPKKEMRASRTQSKVRPRKKVK